MPTGVCLVATWNPQLGYVFGWGPGSEAKFSGKDVSGINILFLKPGESEVVKITFDENAFHYYLDIENKWVMENGLIDILIASSSPMIKLNGNIKL